MLVATIIQLRDKVNELGSEKEFASQKLESHVKAIVSLTKEYSRASQLAHNHKQQLDD